MFSLNRLTLREILFSVIATVYLAGAAIYYMYVYTSLKYSVVLDYDDLLISKLECRLPLYIGMTGKIIPIIHIILL